MRWSVYGRVYASKYLGTVEADTEEEALKKAEEDLDWGVSVCHQCSHDISDPAVEDVIVEVDE